jgi:hypothetical protein
MATTGNSDLKSFAVFVNSKASLVNTSQKSDVIIPFTANLAFHDPLKVVKFTIVDVLFTNVFYNIRVNFQTFKYLDVWAPGRGVANYTYTVRSVIVPIGFYSYDTLTSYLLNVMGNENSTTTFSGVAPNPTIYYGFGSAYTAITTNEAVPSTASSITFGKVFLQTPALGDLFQPFKSDGTVTTSGISGIYAGKYLIDDSETKGLLHLLGFSSSTNVAPAIPNTPFNGWGTAIYSRQVGSNTQYSFDNILWGTSATEPTFTTAMPTTISDLTGLDDLYIHCAQLRTQYMSGAKNYPLAPSDTVAVIPINVAFGEKMSFVPNFPLESYLINTNVTQLNFRMTNSNNELLDFQGIDWAMTLFITEEEDTSRMQAENGPTGNINTPFRLGSDLSGGAHMEQRLRGSKRQNSGL